MKSALLVAALVAPLSLGTLALGMLPALGADHKVTIKGFAFSPSNLPVVAGDTITFSNADTTTHTATAPDGAFDTGRIEPGKAARVTVSAAGAHQYHCTIHPNMTGTVTAQ